MLSLVDGPRPTLDQFIRHAKKFSDGKFGTELIYETAEEYLTEGELVRLRVVLDAIERKRRGSGGFTVGTTRRRSQDETKAAVLALRKDGKVPAVIADELGVSDEYVARILRAA